MTRRLTSEAIVELARPVDAERAASLRRIRKVGGTDTHNTTIQQPEPGSAQSTPFVSYQGMHATQIVTELAKRVKKGQIIDFDDPNPVNKVTAGVAIKDPRKGATQSDTEGGPGAFVQTSAKSDDCGCATPCAYCAARKSIDSVTLEAAFRVAYKAEPGAATTDFVIYGPANVAILDTEREVVDWPNLSQSIRRKALEQLLKRARLSVDHKDVLVGEIVPEFKAADGALYRTDIHVPTAQDLAWFPDLNPNEEALFVCGKIWDDTVICLKVRDMALAGEVDCYSITFHPLKSVQKCNDIYCGDFVTDLDLYASTLCKRGKNSGSRWRVLDRAVNDSGAGTLALASLLAKSKASIEMFTTSLLQRIPTVRFKADAIISNCTSCKEAQALLVSVGVPEAAASEFLRDKAAEWTATSETTDLKEKSDMPKTATEETKEKGAEQAPQPTTGEAILQALADIAKRQDAIDTQVQALMAASKRDMVAEKEDEDEEEEEAPKKMRKKGYDPEEGNHGPAKGPGLTGKKVAKNGGHSESDTTTHVGDAPEYGSHPGGAQRVSGKALEDEEEKKPKVRAAKKGDDEEEIVVMRKSDLTALFAEIAEKAAPGTTVLETKPGGRTALPANTPRPAGTTSRGPGGVPLAQKAKGLGDALVQSYNERHGIPAGGAKNDQEE